MNEALEKKYYTQSTEKTEPQRLNQRLIRQKFGKTA